MDKILVRRGLKGDLPDLDEGEFGYCTDTREVFIGTSTATNVPVGGASNLDGLTDVDTTTTAPTNGQVLKYDSATSLWKPGTVTGGGGGPTLVASYTHTKNKEVAVSAINYTDGTFSSTGHGLALNDTVTIIPNKDMVNSGVNAGNGGSYVVGYYPTGISARTKYYVVNPQTDSFQLSATSGGAAIVPTNPNSTVDVTKWHFERQVDSTIDFGTLPAAGSKFRIVLSGKVLRSNTGQLNVYAGSLQFPYTNLLVSTNTIMSGFGNGVWSLAGDMHTYREYDLNSEGYYYIRQRGVDYATNTTSAYTATVRDNTGICQDYTFFNKQITKITIINIDAANGLTVQLYSM
jgi:hypothetical protein